MAMTMIGEVQLPASRETVWTKLNEPAVLRSCIPGCEQLDRNSDNEFQAVATIKIGPVRARWKGKVRFSDLDPPNSYRISGEGGGRGRWLCQRRRQGLALRQGWRHAAVLQCRSADRREAGSAWTTPHQQCGEEDCRRFLRKFRRRGHAEDGLRGHSGASNVKLT
jgi:hypothetical protein